MSVSDAKNIMSKYTKGRMFEYKCRKLLEARGFYVVRAAGSKGLIDLVAWKRDPFFEIKTPITYAVQCKTGSMSTQAWNELYWLCTEICALPILAVPNAKNRGKISWYKILAPKDKGRFRPMVEIVPQ